MAPCSAGVSAYSQACFYRARYTSDKATGQESFYRGVPGRTVDGLAKRPTTVSSAASQFGSVRAKRLRSFSFERSELCGR